MDSRVLVTHFRRFPEFHALSDEELCFLAEKAQFRTIPKTELIYRSEEPANKIYLLLNGCVKVGIYAPDGREIIKNIQYPLTIFGEQAITGEKKRTEFAAAMNHKVELCMVKAEDIRALLHANSGLADAMMKNLGDRLRRLSASGNRSF